MFSIVRCENNDNRVWMQRRTEFSLGGEIKFTATVKFSSITVGMCVSECIEHLLQDVDVYLISLLAYTQVLKCVHLLSVFYYDE